MIFVSAFVAKAALQYSFGRSRFSTQRVAKLTPAAIRCGCSVALAALLALGVASSTHALVITDDFSDGTDGSLGTATNPTPSPPNVTGEIWSRLDDEIVSTGQTWDASTGEYRLTAPNNGINLTNLGNVGFVASYVGSNSFTDVTVSADFVSPTAAGYSFGVMVRSNGGNSFGGLQGYVYNYRGGIPRMEISRFNGLSIGSIADTVLATPLDLVNKKYKFTLTAIGNQLTGQVFEIGGGLVTTTTVADTNVSLALTSGYSGVLGLSGTIGTGTTPSAPLGSTLDFTIDNFRTEDVVAGVPGDYNNNGKVDAADYVLWRNGGPLLNEVDSPGTVNAADYTEWRARFGNPPGSGAGLGGSSSVPEPTGVVLALLGLASSCLARRQPRC